MLAQGERIQNDCKKKVRLFETIFHDSLRVEFLTRDHSMSRQEIDT